MKRALERLINKYTLDKVRMKGIENLPIFKTEEELIKKLETSKRIKIKNIAEIAITDQKEHRKPIKGIYYVLGRSDSMIFPYPQSDVDLYVIEKIKLKRDFRARGRYLEIEEIRFEDVKRLDTFDVRMYRSLLR